MEVEKFEELVVEALSDLPAEFRDKLENIDVVVRDRPTPRQLARVGLRRGWTLLGLYEGVPRTKRTTGYNLVLPDRITLFQKPIEAKCRSEEEIADEVRRVVSHEIAHYFGIDDHSLRSIERSKLRRANKKMRP